MQSCCTLDTSVQQSTGAPHCCAHDFQGVPRCHKFQGACVSLQQSTTAEQNRKIRVLNSQWSYQHCYCEPGKHKILTWAQHKDSGGMRQIRSDERGHSPQHPKGMSTQEVVVADVLIARHIHYLDTEQVGDLALANPPCSGGFAPCKHCTNTRCTRT